MEEKISPKLAQIGFRNLNSFMKKLIKFHEQNNSFKNFVEKKVKIDARIIWQQPHYLVWTD